MKLPNWPALLVAPSLALGHLSLVYALVTPACTRQTVIMLHAAAAGTLLLCVLLTLPAVANWRRGHAYSGADDAAARQRFTALVAWLSGALSCLVVLAQWLPMWVLSPCFG
ncbi:hypothetical protein IP92_01832 [Pseudoduganella flava]|uniref:Uncharacterized protein n=1 Tax=Pseudoduganella flava TaxID=871742 RepID=A0A562PVP0_9BURK|nr:hypothetical protein [Pseudoduganella flava]QGZ39549.1 hypothetical protein GO485_11155 [Pseudoduganella flava]TWI48443.1 hypothetical protein IP92_01832 [Pseudoduganella flava]